MNTPAPKTSPDAALGNVMAAALDVPAASEQPAVNDDTIARTGNTADHQAGWFAGMEQGQANAQDNAAIRAGAGWLPIESAPKDGTEFQAWLNVGLWEPRCRFNPDSEAFEIWGRVDYDRDDWDACGHLTATHWMPKPAAPGVSTVEEDGTTPGATWREKGEADPHGTRYNCERAALTLGTLTDDELANGAFLAYDRQPSVDELLSGKGFTPIVWMTAVKDRIRWLSRKLAEAEVRPAPGAGDAQTAAARDVLAERQRQISVEGFNAQRDDGYTSCQLARAAAGYAVRAGDRIDYPPLFWPWENLWWKPRDQRHDLVRAGALILAEIERLDRAAVAAQQGKGGEK